MRQTACNDDYYDYPVSELLEYDARDRFEERHGEFFQRTLMHENDTRPDLFEGVSNGTDMGLYLLESLGSGDSNADN